MPILDTNVVSELMRKVPNPKVLEYLQQQPSSQLWTTTISQAEILYGIEIMPCGSKRDLLLSQAEALFLQDFSGKILSFDCGAAKQFSILAGKRRSLGRPISQFDGQIAAIVHASRGTLITRNTQDFEDCQIRLVNPWETEDPA